ncbi:hypothetical protein DUD43_07380 [Alcaligenes faecalis]|uniref:hypothetical protein n=1 Tax=Alcaligenes faecalis TaxID=511 RepID=UPI0012937DA5|nr:hypothetical protein [Alcaligenes faecalis]QFY77521.1 hypothetical protein DUD43_07380 [Alcaligenes faecalis]
MTSPLALFPQRIAIGKVNVGGRDVPVHISPEFFRALQDVLRRVGGPSSEIGSLNQFFDEVSPSGAIGLDDIASGALMFGQSVSQPVGGQDVVGAGEAVMGFPMAEDYQFERAGPVVQPAQYQSSDQAPVMAQPVADQSALPFQALSVTSSPMQIQADRRCAIQITGATTAMTLSRAGVDLVITGAPLIELNLGDTLTVEYTTAPAITLIPR